MKKIFVLALAVAMLGAVVPGHAATGVDRFIQGSRFCDSQSQFRPGPAVVDGPSGQLAVHTEVFEPAFANACRLGSGLLTYLGTGDQSGINVMLERRADRAFGTADIPLSTVELYQAMFDQRAPDRRGRNTQFNHIPLFVSVEAVAYNLTSCSVPRLNLRSSVLSLIYSGQITRWNDKLLVQDNPALATCDFSIRLVKRGDFAGTTFTLKDYMSKRNPIWSYYKQPAQNQLWPTVTNHCPAWDEDAMAECVGTTQNSIGYVQYHTARLNGLRTAYLDNVTSQAQTDRARAFVPPSPQGCTDAAASAFVPPPVKNQYVPVGPLTYETTSFSYTQGDWSSISLTDAPAGYPLCSFGYAFLYQNYQIAYFGQQFTANTGRTSVDYLWTALTPAAQNRLPAFDYGKLPPNVVEVGQVGLSAIRLF